MPLLSKPDFCSLLVAVDEVYIDKLMLTYPTWARCHPEILNMPHVIVADCTMDQIKLGIFSGLVSREAQLAKVPAPSVHIVTTDSIHCDGDYFVSQRERMLTALVRGADKIKTPWYWKMDADTYANKKCGFYYDRWFRGSPAFIANPWGYTKPATSLDQMNKWFDAVVVSNHPELAHTAPIHGELVEREPGDKWKVKHRRMASWTMFGNTEWTQQMSAYQGTGRLPFPSQDTYLSYLAERLGKPWVDVKFRNYGWEHCRNIKGLAAACEEVLKGLTDG